MEQNTRSETDSSIDQNLVYNKNGISNQLDKDRFS